MAKRNYGFVRSYSSLGRDLDDIQKFIAAGYGGVLFDYNDQYLAEAIADVRAAGIPFGIWGDPGTQNPNQFALRMAGLYNQYKPEIMVPDIEFIGKGYEGSPGWAYNQQLAELWKQYMPSARTAVTVMPNQKDFNYEAWMKANPLTEWLPQAYGADPRTAVFDPAQIVRTLIERGIDPSLISPVLGVGHDTRGSDYGGASRWTIDDYIGRDFPKASGLETPQTASGGSGAPTSGTKGRPKLPNNVLTPLGVGASQSPDRIKQQGLQWGGRVFNNQADFATYLKQRGQTYADWARNHQPAAAALRGR